MGCDMMLARGAATVGTKTLVAVHWFDSARQRVRLQAKSVGKHPLDAVIPLDRFEIPQARHTHAVLGVQTDDDSWGFQFGCNDQRLTVGVARWRSRLPHAAAGLSGAELTRLALERGRSAMHAVEILTDLIARYGQREADQPDAHAVFLIADATEACVLEVAGSYWACLECAETRAVADVGLIRQDWKRLSSGLAEQAIHNGWWNDDGTKLDFAGSLGLNDADHAWGLKRWSKATLALAQRQGAIDPYSFRRLLAQQHDACVRRHDNAPRGTRLLGSLIADLHAPGTPLVWFARGAVDAPLYFPIPVGCEPSAPLSGRAAIEQPVAVDARAERLQQLFDQDAEEYLNEARELERRGETAARVRLGQAMILRHAEQWEGAGSRRLDQPAAAMPRPSRAEEELTPFAFG